MLIGFHLFSYSESSIHFHRGTYILFFTRPPRRSSSLHLLIRLLRQLLRSGRQLPSPSQLRLPLQSFAPHLHLLQPLSRRCLTALSWQGWYRLSEVATV